MTIRARLTYWYAGILFVSVLLISGLSYYEFAHERALKHPSGENASAREKESPEFGKTTEFAEPRWRNATMRL